MDGFGAVGALGLPDWVLDVDYEAWRAFFDLAGDATFTEDLCTYNPDGSALNMSLFRANQAGRR